MKKLVLSLLVMAGVLTSCIQVNEVKSNQPMKTEQRQVSFFERINLQGSPAIYYSQGDTVSVRVEAPADLMEYIKTEVRDSCLYVHVKSDVKSVIGQIQVFGDNDVKVYVSSPDLIDVSVLGSGDFICDNLLDTDNLKLELRGSGDMDFADIICDRIETLLVGSGDIKVQHVVAGSSSVEVVGSGDVEINHDRVANTDITLKGSGDVKSSFNGCGAVTCNVIGSGDVDLSGRVRSFQHKVVGSGDCHFDGLQIQNP